MDTKQFSMDTITMIEGTIFPDTLSDIIGKARSKPLHTAALMELGIAGLVKAHTGLTVRVMVSEQCPNASVQLMPLRNNHTVVNDTKNELFARYNLVDRIVKYISVMGSLSLSVDIEKGMVDDHGSNIPWNIQIGTKLLNNPRYTDQELTAVLLHEIGHVMSYLELIGRMVKTNHILDELDRRLLDDKPDIEKVKLVIASAYNTYMDGKLDADGYRTVVVNSAYQQSTDELGVNLFSNRGCEQLADIYVTRLGYGVHLAIGMDKLYNGRDIDKDEVDCRLAMTRLATIGNNQFNPILPSVLSGRNNTDRMERVYDPLNERVARIKLELVTILKDRLLDDSTIDTLLTDINRIDSILTKYPTSKPYLDMLSAQLSDDAMYALGMEAFQQELDAMANNPLFILAAKFNQG